MSKTYKLLSQVDLKSLEERTKMNEYLVSFSYRGNPVREVIVEGLGLNSKIQERSALRKAVLSFQQRRRNKYLIWDHATIEPYIEE